MSHVEKAVVPSPKAAVNAASDRSFFNLRTFPAKVWALGHAPDTEPVVVQDETTLYTAVEQAIIVSRNEHGKEGAEIEWAPNQE